MVKRAHPKPTKKKMRRSASGKKQTRKISTSKKHKQSKGSGLDGISHGKEELSIDQQIRVLADTQSGILETLKTVMNGLNLLKADTAQQLIKNVEFVENELSKLQKVIYNLQTQINKLEHK
jgi:hypothetical protein